jgi:glutamate dehydrogenase (NADP+)
MSQATFDQTLQQVFQTVQRRNPNEAEFHQAVREVIDTLGPVLEREPALAEPSLLQRLCEPERQIIFRVPWQDDAGHVQVNRGFRVQFNSALGPYKGGLRFHPSVDLSIMKFLSFEQVLKNALTGMPLGAGKGGADFDPKGKSDSEVMRFCQSFMTELHRHIGEDTDVPAGDIGVGHREIGYLLGQYRRLVNRNASGVITGKPVSLGGSPAREKATGFGAATFAEQMLQVQRDSLEGKTIIVSGAGNVALFAIERAQQLGGHVVACSDSQGVLYHKQGLDIALLKDIKLQQNGSVRDYCKHHRDAQFSDEKSIWSLPCDVAMPCATQNELDAEAARQLIDQGCVALSEGANMPCTPEAADRLRQAGVLYGPGKAANAGGVATSALEMQQNATGESWSESYATQRLTEIMESIHTLCYETAEHFGEPGNYVLGANIAGYRRVAQAMLAQGVV